MICPCGEDDCKLYGYCHCGCGAKLEPLTQVQRVRGMRVEPGGYAMFAKGCAIKRFGRRLRRERYASRGG